MLRSSCCHSRVGRRDSIPSRDRGPSAITAPKSSQDDMTALMGSCGRPSTATGLIDATVVPSPNSPPAFPPQARIFPSDTSSACTPAPVAWVTCVNGSFTGTSRSAVVTQSGFSKFAPRPRVYPAVDRHTSVKGHRTRERSDLDVHREFDLRRYRRGCRCRPLPNASRLPDSPRPDFAAFGQHIEVEIDAEICTIVPDSRPPSWGRDCRSHPLAE